MYTFSKYQMTYAKLLKLLILRDLKYRFKTLLVASKYRTIKFLNVSTINKLSHHIHIGNIQSTSHPCFHKTHVGFNYFFMPKTSANEFETFASL